MATITARKRKDGSLSYTAQIRLKRGGAVIFQESATFDRRALASAWAVQRHAELQVPGALERVTARITIGDLIRRTIEHLETVRPLGRTRRLTGLALAASDLGAVDAAGLTVAQVTAWARRRVLGGAAPPTVQNDLIALRTAFKLGRSLLGLPLDVQVIDDAAAQVRALGWSGASRHRERRPTAEEWARLSAFFEGQAARSDVPMLDVMRFAVASTRRLSEICALQWADIRASDRTAIVRDLKHPLHKIGNDARFKLLSEAWALIERQPRVHAKVFPYSPKTVSAYFTRACRVLEIADLHFHDLRHHGISLLFERGYAIQEVQLVTLHQSWQTLRRYTHLNPGDLIER